MTAGNEGIIILIVLNTNRVIMTDSYFTYFMFRWIEATKFNFINLSAVNVYKNSASTFLAYSDGLDTHNPPRSVLAYC